jgi:hypothetical protein
VGDFVALDEPSGGCGFRPGIAAWTTAALLMTVAMTRGRTVVSEG